MDFLFRWWWGGGLMNGLLSCGMCFIIISNIG
jgi:hypothetical protein